MLIADSLLSPTGRTQSADLVLCDRIAADPSDPDKPADVKGTPEIAQSDIATAIKFCKVASGSSRRAMYELGRAYAANRQMPEAVAAWRKAADKGSTSAMVELGVLLGTGSGGTKDQAAARRLFERAAEAGNPRGVSNLAALGGGAPDPGKARMKPPRGPGSRRRRSKITPVRWSAWEPSPRADEAARRIPRPPTPTTKRPQRSAMRVPRLR
jgi:hypothetical protein